LSLLEFCSLSSLFSLKSTTALSVSLDGMPGSTLPIKAFDPLGFANAGSEETFRWFQAAELKNGRTAMAATVGYLVAAAGIHFPGMLSSDVSFESISALKPIDQWAAVPVEGKAQILLTCFVAELVTEGYQGTHYMKGGSFPTMVFPPIDFSGVSEATMLRKRNSELNNGRLAMIAMMGFFAEANIPGSVPVLTSIGKF
jgi:Chlorophyll A-B binding protein